MTSEPFEMKLPGEPLRAIAFDMDGLIVNSEDVYLHVGTETLARRGHPFEEELRHKMMGQPARQSLQLMIDWHGLSDAVEDLIAESESLFWRFAKDLLEPMPGVRELLDALNERDLPRCVVTSGGRRYAEKILDLAGVTSDFSFLVTADDIRQGKPNPEPYLTAAFQHGVAPEEMMVLEDSGTGCRSAVAAGAYAVAVPNSHTVSHPFEGVAFIANTLCDPRIGAVLGPQAC